MAWDELFALRSLRRPFFTAWLGADVVQHEWDQHVATLMDLADQWEELEWPPVEIGWCIRPVPPELTEDPAAFRTRVMAEIALADVGPPFSEPLPLWVLTEEDGQRDPSMTTPPGAGPLDCEAAFVLGEIDRHVHRLYRNGVKIDPPPDPEVVASAVADLRACIERWEGLPWPPTTPPLLDWNLPESIRAQPTDLRSHVEHIIEAASAGPLRVDDQPHWSRGYFTAVAERCEEIWAACEQFKQQPDGVATGAIVMPQAPPVARRGARPAPRFIRHWSDAEQVACEWMQWMGFADARLTGSGADGGADVVAADAVAQVKDWGGAVPLAEVQRMVGVAAERGRDLTIVMFARAGYTQQAIDAADRLKIALFEFDLSGEPTPASSHAHILMNGDRPIA